MPETKQLTKLRALPLPPAIRALADELAASQRQLDGMRAAGAAAVNVEKMRDQMLTAAEQKVSRHYSLMRQGPQAVVSQIKREYVQQPHGREQECVFR
jgi:tyrosyl-tRNA synthetase